MSRLEEAKFIIGRFDHYYDSVNNKGNLYLFLNTFILGGMISGYHALDKLYQFECIYKYILFSASLVNLSSIIFTLFAIQPFFSKRPKNNTGSLYYFGNIAVKSISDYKKVLTKASEKTLESDAVKQVHALAIGLKKKFERIRIASMLIGIQAIIILIFILLITINY